MSKLFGQVTGHMSSFLPLSFFFLLPLESNIRQHTQPQLCLLSLVGVVCLLLVIFSFILEGELLAFLVFIPSSLSMVEGGRRVAVFSVGFYIKLVMLNCCFFLFSFSRLFSIFVGRGARRNLTQFSSHFVAFCHVSSCFVAQRHFSNLLVDF